jgi:hypothetical protein
MVMSPSGRLMFTLNDIGIMWELNFLYNITTIYIIDFTLSFNHELHLKVVYSY